MVQTNHCGQSDGPPGKPRSAVLRCGRSRLVADSPAAQLLVRPDRDVVADLIREERDRALATAAARAAELAPGLQIDTDPPAQAVTGSGSGASMLVLGAHGTGALGSIALGSVSWYAGAHASCPVVVVRGETAAIHQEIGIGIGDLDASADRLRSRSRRQRAQGQPDRRPRLAHTASGHLARWVTVAGARPGRHRSRSRPAARRTAG